MLLTKKKKNLVGSIDISFFGADIHTFHVSVFKKMLIFFFLSVLKFSVWEFEAASEPEEQAG